MAVLKAKKSTNKLKSGKKKTINKWIIFGGVIIVAVVGAVVVRFSGASSWHPVWRITGKWSMSTQTAFFSTSGSAGLKNPVYGRTYRVCVRGYSSGSTSSARIAALVNYGGSASGGKINMGTDKTLAVSTKSYGSSSVLHCSGSFKAGKDYNYAIPVFRKVSGPNISVTAVSIEELR